MARQICRMTGETSLVSDGTDFYIVKDDGRFFKFTRFTGGRPTYPLVSMVNLREGVVHCLHEDGEVVQITSNGSAEDFRVQVVKR